jgi:hypothetical protein
MLNAVHSVLATGLYSTFLPHITEEILFHFQLGTGYPDVLRGFLSKIDL